MTFRISLLFALLLVGPAVARAELITLRSLGTPFGGGYFNDDGFIGELSAILARGDFSREIESVRFYLESGPLQSLVVVRNASGEALQSTYTFAPGVLRFEYRAPTDPRRNGFSAPIPDFTFTITRERDADCIAGSCPSTNQAMFVGEGLLSPEVAAFFGVERETLPFSFGFNLEVISGEPEPGAFRAGPFNSLSFSFQAQAVPEPSAGILLSIAALAWRSRGRRCSVGVS